MKTILFTVLLLINAHAFAVNIEGYCINDPLPNFPVTEEEVAGRNAWARKCFPDLVAMFDFDGTLTVSTYNNALRPGVLVFGIRNQMGQWTQFDTPMSENASCDGLEGVRLRAICPFNN